MYLLDTNILLRFLLPNDPTYSTIRKAVRILKMRGEQLVTTPQNLAEFWNVCTRPSTARGGLGLTVAATERRLSLLERNFPILLDQPELYGHWNILVRAYNVMGVQVHDARLVASMIGHGVTDILTSNVADFNRYPFVKVSAPDDIV